MPSATVPADYSKLGNDAAANETGRASKLAVLALKARTLLYQASPLFNESNDNERWHQAAMANKAVIDSCGKYGVKAGQIFRSLGRGQLEIQRK